MSMKLKQRQSETSLKVSWQYFHRTLYSASTVHRNTVMRFFLHNDCYNSVNVIHVIVHFDIKRWTGYIQLAITLYEFVFQNVFQLIMKIMPLTENGITKNWIFNPQANIVSLY